MREITSEKEEIRTISLLEVLVVLAERTGLQDMDMTLFLAATDPLGSVAAPEVDSASLDCELERAKGSQLGEQQPISAIRPSSSTRGAVDPEVEPDNASSPVSLADEEERPERSIVQLLVVPLPLEVSKKADIAAEGCRIVKLELENNCKGRNEANIHRER